MINLKNRFSVPQTMMAHSRPTAILFLRDGIETGSSLCPSSSPTWRWDTWHYMEYFIWETRGQKQRTEKKVTVNFSSPPPILHFTHTSLGDKAYCKEFSWARLYFSGVWGQLQKWENKVSIGYRFHISNALGDDSVYVDCNPGCHGELSEAGLVTVAHTG